MDTRNYYQQPLLVSEIALGDNLCVLAPSGFGRDRYSIYGVEVIKILKTRIDVTTDDGKVYSFQRDHTVVRGLKGRSVWDREWRLTKRDDDRIPGIRKHNARDRAIRDIEAFLKDTDRPDFAAVIETAQTYLARHGD